MPATGNDLAPEIWIAIAEEVITDEYYSCGRLSSRYMAVNRIFFNLYLDAVYGDVQWTNSDNETMKQLQRLQEPTIASHVRSLTIHAAFIDTLLQWPDARLFILSLQSRIPSFLSRGAEPRSVNQTPPILDLMISSLPKMKNVVEFHLAVRDLKLKKGSTRCLVAARQAFSSSLHKLSLHISILKFNPILEFSAFRNLSELELHFDCPRRREHGEDVAEASKPREVQKMRDTVMPFINAHRNTLRSLTIASYSLASSPDFFKSIGLLQSLRRLSVSVCLNSNDLLDFIRTHSLLELDIRPPRGAEHTTHQLEEMWIRIQSALLSHRDAARSLKGLHIPVGDFDACLALIKRSSRSLTHLSLRDQFLYLQDVRRVLFLFVHHPFPLKSLMIHVQDLSVRLLQLLADRLPGLHSLVLLFQTCSFPHPALLFFSPGCLSRQIQFHWQIEHISLIQTIRPIGPEDEDLLCMGIQPSGTLTDHTAMRMLSQALPSIKSRKGIHWHKQLPPRQIMKIPEPVNA